MDLMVTDPPYNVNYEATNGNKIKNDNMSSENFYRFLLAFYKNSFEVMRDGAAYYIFHADENMKFPYKDEELNSVITFDKIDESILNKIVPIREKKLDLKNIIVQIEPVPYTIHDALYL